jgi:hypothetical protein
VHRSHGRTRGSPCPGRALAGHRVCLRPHRCGGAAASCGSAACVVSTQWPIHGIPTEAGGTLFQVQYDYIKQDQLGQMLLASLDYTFDQNWGVTATLPLYRYVNGTQLAVNWAAVGGVTFRF